VTQLDQALKDVVSARWAGQATGGEAAARAQRCLAWLKGRRPTAALLRAMVRDMAAAGLGPASCNRHLSSLSAVMSEAYGAAAPAVPWQREPKGRTRWLTADEVSQLAQACLPHRHGPAIAALVRFLAETGVRVGEALALTWADLELEGRALARVRTSKNGEGRTVPLTEEAVQAARTRLTQHTGPWHGLSQSTLNHVFRAAREAVATTRGDAQVVVHTLRHTAASRLVRAGVSLPVVSAWLGHRDHRSTLRYVHVDEAGLQNAVRLLQEHQ